MSSGFITINDMPLIALTQLEKIEPENKISIQNESQLKLIENCDEENIVREQYLDRILLKPKPLCIKLKFKHIVLNYKKFNKNKKK